MIQPLLLSSPHRRRTTVIGGIICTLAVIGLFLSGLQWVAISILDFSRLPGPPPSKPVLYGAAFAATLPKIALLATGLAWLRRESWTRSLLLVTVLLSVADAVWQWQVITPRQLANLPTDAQRFGYFAGLYAVYFGAATFYLSLYLFLRSKGARVEFARPNPPPYEAPVPS